MKMLPRCAALVTGLLVAGGAAATIPERAPPEIGQLPAGVWVLEPLANRPCGGDFCEAGSYQPPFKILVREIRSQNRGSEVTIIVEADGCAASTNTWAETTGLSVTQRFELLRARVDQQTASLRAGCHLAKTGPVEIDGAVAVFERFDR